MHGEVGNRVACLCSTLRKPDRNGLRGCSPGTSDLKAEETSTGSSDYRHWLRMEKKVHHTPTQSVTPSHIYPATTHGAHLSNIHSSTLSHALTQIPIHPLSRLFIHPTDYLPVLPTSTISPSCPSIYSSPSTIIV